MRSIFSRVQGCEGVSSLLDPTPSVDACCGESPPALEAETSPTLTPRSIPGFPKATRVGRSLILDCPLLPPSLPPACFPSQGGREPAPVGQVSHLVVGEPRPSLLPLEQDSASACTSPNVWKHGGGEKSRLTTVIVLLIQEFGARGLGGSETGRWGLGGRRAPVGFVERSVSASSVVYSHG